MNLAVSLLINFIGVYAEEIYKALVFCDKLKEIWIKTGSKLISYISYLMMAWPVVVLITVSPFFIEFIGEFYWGLKHVKDSPTLLISMAFCSLKFVWVINCFLIETKYLLISSNILKNNRYIPLELKLFNKCRVQLGKSEILL